MLFKFVFGGKAQGAVGGFFWRVGVWDCFGSCFVIVGFVALDLDLFLDLVLVLILDLKR